ncbi:hypothetical protein GGF32_003935 [Allomyces javanicus]|nr:hypothetical protein GGF32_003935 [Allomyces javanicus]
MIYDAMNASGRITDNMFGMVANLLASNPIVQPNAPVGKWWGADRVAAIRTVMDDAVPIAERDWWLYDAHFETLGKLGKYDIMFELHEEVMLSGMPVGIKYFTYFIAIATRLGKSGLARALDYLEQMQALSLSPDGKTLAKLRREIVLHNDMSAKARLE